MRSNQKKGSLERSLLAVEKNQLLGNLFWNNTWQAIQSKKGGTKSGRKNALSTRQGKIMRETLKRITYWQAIQVWFV